MTIQEAFTACLEGKIKGAVPKSTLASYKRRAALGELKEETMRELLLENGFEIVADEQWSHPEEKYFDVLFLDKTGALSVKTLQAKSPGEACRNVSSSEGVALAKTEDATGANPRKVARLANKLLNSEFFS